MAKLFSDEWMNQLKDAWNADEDVRGKLSEMGFSTNIACGFKGDENPLGVFVVENGECVRAGDWHSLNAKPPPNPGVLLPQNVFSCHRMCSLATKCVLLLQNVFS